jgi:hypothetical protein
MTTLSLVDTVEGDESNPSARVTSALSLPLSDSPCVTVEEQSTSFWGECRDKIVKYREAIAHAIKATLTIAADVVEVPVAKAPLKVAAAVAKIFEVCPLISIMTTSIDDPSRQPGKTRPKQLSLPTSFLVSWIFSQ